MPTPFTYYLNAPSLSSATGVFLDPELSICAPDGYYSDGLVVRYLDSCVLQEPQSCPGCGLTCDFTPITLSAGPKAVYQLPVNTGTEATDIGAIIVKFTPRTLPYGFQAVINSVVYNKFSSPTYGYLAGTAVGLPVYIGDNTSPCASTIVGVSVLNVPIYAYSGGSFNYSGVDTTVTTLPTQFALTATDPGECIMVIPKTTAIPSILDIEIIMLCTGGGADFDIEVLCPEQLPTIEGGLRGETTEEACDYAGSLITYFVAHVNGGAGVLGLYDWVFSDPNGEFPLPDGFYASADVPAPNNLFEIQNGVVVSFGACIP